MSDHFLCVQWVLHCECLTGETGKSAIIVYYKQLLHHSFLSEDWFFNPTLQHDGLEKTFSLFMLSWSQWNSTLQKVHINTLPVPFLFLPVRHLIWNICRNLWVTIGIRSKLKLEQVLLEEKYLNSAQISSICLHSFLI